MISINQYIYTFDPGLAFSMITLIIIIRNYLFHAQPCYPIVFSPSSFYLDLLFSSACHCIDFLIPCFLISLTPLHHHYYPLHFPRQNSFGIALVVEASSFPYLLAGKLLVTGLAGFSHVHRFMGPP